MIPVKHRLELVETGRGASQYESTAGKLSVTVIVPGMSKNGRNYSKALLKRDYGIFKNAKMFADHQTESESRSKPEGSIRDWVGSLKNVWCEDDGTVKGEAIVVDSTFKKKLELLAANDLLGTMGISIRATGEAIDGEVDGKRCKIVESLLSCRSVDFVTFAAAGGRVDAIESWGEGSTPVRGYVPPTAAETLKAWMTIGLSREEALLAMRGPQENGTDFTVTRRGAALMDRLGLMDPE